MGIMDKAKEAAQQAKASAEKLAQQGQAKVATVQQNRSEGELYRALGEAAYNEQRRGGSHEAVVAALNALDQHFAARAAGSTGESAAPPPAPGASPAPGAPPTGPQGPAAGGDYKLDNL